MHVSFFQDIINLLLHKKMQPYPASKNKYKAVNQI